MRWFGFVLVPAFVFMLSALTLAGEASEMVFPVSFDWAELNYEKHMLSEQSYDLLGFESSDYVSSPGHPALPVRSMSIYVPKGKVVTRIWAEVVDQMTLPGPYKIMPAQPQIPTDGSAKPQIVPPDPAIYESSTPYPASPIAEGPGGSVGGRKIATCRIFPLQYIPSEGKVIVNRSMLIKVSLAGEASSEEIPLETAQVRKLRNDFVSGLVANPEDVVSDFPVEAAPLDASDAAEYLIICLANHADEYEVLKNWKTRKGIPTEIAIQESILANYPGRDDPDRIRNCIKDYYLNRSTNWVLVTLSAPKARIRGCYGKVSGTVDTFIPCDLYFADMDGDWNADGDSYWGETTDDVDLYPDVYVGRITANKGVTCSTVVYKVLTYEGCYAMPTDYQLDMLFMAEYLDDYTNEALLKNRIDNESVPARFDPITKLYESSGNLNWANAMNELNAGNNIINHAGHGNINIIEIADDILTSTDMENLTNAPRYSVFYTVACDPGAFDNLTGCFAKSFLEATDGGGFIIANSRLGWYWSGNPGNGTSDKYDREFFKSIFNRGYTNLGVAHADAKIQRIPYAGSDGTERWAMYSLNLLGDPETPIWIDTPIAMTVAHPETVDTGPQTFTVTASAGGSPLNGARVCIWKGDEIYMVDQTDVNGEASFSISPADTGDMLVTVTKNGYLPYQGTTRVGSDISGISPSGLGLPSITASPNPARGSVLLRFSPGGSGAMKLAGEGASVEIIDVAGRVARTIRLDEATIRRGTLTWDGTTTSGMKASPGIYFVRFSLGKASATSKLIVLK